MHPLHESLHDGQAEAGADDFALGAGMLTGELLEDMGQILLAHADAVVLNRKGIAARLRLLSRQFFHRHRNLSALGRILDGVADDIQQDLPHFGAVAHNIGMFDLRMVGAGQLFLPDRGLEDVRERLHQRAQVAGFFFQHSLAALDAGHFQHIVDEREQKCAGRAYLLGVIQHLVLLVDVLFQKLRKADDGVHRGADVMAHIEQEAGLCLVGCPGLLRRLFKGRFMLQVLLVPVHELPAGIGRHHADDGGDGDAQRELLVREPPGFRNDLKIPGIVGDAARNFQRVAGEILFALRDDDLFAGIGVFFPDLIPVARILHLVQLDLLHEVVPL